MRRLSTGSNKSIEGSIGATDGSSMLLAGENGDDESLKRLQAELKDKDEAIKSLEQQLHALNVRPKTRSTSTSRPTRKGSILNLRHRGSQVMAIGKNRGSQVMAIGKKIVRGSIGVTGRIFHRRNERLKRLSTTMNKESTTTRWDNAVDVIDELLADERRLTPQQRQGLRGVQELLIMGVQDENVYHIPMCLLDASRNDTADNEQDMEKKDFTTNNNYFLREYGGVKLQEKRPALLRQSAVPGSQFSSAVGDDLWDETIPAEFSDLPINVKEQLTKILTWENIKNWDFDIFELDELSSNHPLVLMGWAILGAPHAQRAMAKATNTLGDCEEVDLEGYNFVESTLKVPLEKLCLYLRLVEDNYSGTNPYHNKIHAADVLQSLHSLIQMAGDEVKGTNEELFSILLAAITHDVGHPGLNNDFQVNARTDLALQYNDSSVLENFHASQAFIMMCTTKTSPNGIPAPLIRAGSDSINLHSESPYNILCHTSNEQFMSIKKKTIDAILHTDMKQHFQSVSKIKSMILSEDKNDSESDATWQLLVFMLHMADISNPAKQGLLAMQWADRCLQEFFAQGRKEIDNEMEISPLCDEGTTSKPESQIGFIQYIVLPSYEVLACIIPEIKEVVIPHIENNRQFWESQNLMTDFDDFDATTDGGSDSSVI